MKYENGFSNVQVYAPTNNAEAELFCEDLQDLLKPTPKKMSFT